jgi:hypothetical protein
LHEKTSDFLHVRVLKLRLAVNLFDLNRHLLLESSDNLAAALLNKLLAFFHYVGWHNIIKIFGRNLDLYSLDAVATHNANSILLELFFINRVLNWIFEADEPFNLRFNIRLLRVQNHIRNAQGPQREAIRVVAAIDAFDLFEGHVGFGLLRL